MKEDQEERDNIQKPIVLSRFIAAKCRNHLSLSPKRERERERERERKRERERRRDLCSVFTSLRCR